MIVDVIEQHLICKAIKIKEPHPSKCKMDEGYRIRFNLSQIEVMRIKGVEDLIIHFMENQYRLYYYEIQHQNLKLEKPISDYYRKDSIKQPKRQMAYSKDEAKKIANDLRQYLNNLESVDIYTKNHGKGTLNR